MPVVKERKLKEVEEKEKSLEELRVEKFEGSSEELRGRAGK